MGIVSSCDSFFPKEYLSKERHIMKIILALFSLLAAQYNDEDYSGDSRVTDDEEYFEGSGGYTDISEYGSDQRELELLEDAKTHISTSTSSMKTVTDYEIEPDDYEQIEDILTKSREDY